MLVCSWSDCISNWRLLRLRTLPEQLRCLHGCIIQTKRLIQEQECAVEKLCCQNLLFDRTCCNGPIIGSNPVRICLLVECCTDGQTEVKTSICLPSLLKKPPLTWPTTLGLHLRGHHNDTVQSQSNPEWALVLVALGVNVIRPNISEPNNKSIVGWMNIYVANGK